MNKSRIILNVSSLVSFRDIITKFIFKPHIRLFKRRSLNDSLIAIIAVLFFGQISCFCESSQQSVVNVIIIFRQFVFSFNSKLLKTVRRSTCELNARKNSLQSTDPMTRPSANENICSLGIQGHIINCVILKMSFLCFFYTICFHIFSHLFSSFQTSRQTILGIR